MTFSRRADKLLLSWHAHPRRKPLILRGARQTGKTTAVRRLGAHAPLFIELNLERPQDLSLVRTCQSASDLLQRLRQDRDLPVLPSDSLLFLDEIQEHPEAVRWLRFFYEDHPELAVIAAGSLLEVRLRNETFAFPVGRVEFQRLEPLTFLEFLRATEDNQLADDLEQAFQDPHGVHEGLHHLAMGRLRSFLLVGGLPEAVGVWKGTRNLVEVSRVHRSLHQAYTEDLLKYRTSGETHHLEVVLAAAPAHYGARFKVRNFSPGETDRSLTQALDLLEKAMVLHRATPTSRRSLPLLPRMRAARKLLPLDIGLALSQFGVRPDQLENRRIESLLDGRIAEAFVGTQLLAANTEQPRALSFWTREGSAHSNAEVDYLVPTPMGVLPVEVKSGAAGTLRSLHRYLAGADADLGIRLSAAPGGLEHLRVSLGDGEELTYELRSVPLYLAELIPALQEDASGS